MKYTADDSIIVGNKILMRIAFLLLHHLPYHSALCLYKTSKIYKRDLRNFFVWDIFASNGQFRSLETVILRSSLNCGRHPGKGRVTARKFFRYIIDRSHLHLFVGLVHTSELGTINFFLFFLSHFCITFAKNSTDLL